MLAIFGSHQILIDSFVFEFFVELEYKMSMIEQSARRYCGCFDGCKHQEFRNFIITK